MLTTLSARKSTGPTLWTRPRTLPIGLQIGARTVTLAQLMGMPGALQIHAFAQGTLALRDGASPEEQDRETAAVLKQLVSDHRFKGRQVVSCLGTHELFVQNVRLPQLPEDEIDKVIQWEAAERLPYPAAEAEIRHLLAGEVRQDNTPKQEVIVLACQREAIRRHIGMLEQAGLVPAAIDLEACALLRCLLAGREPATGQRTAYLHLGETATTVLLAEQGRVLFLKAIGIGGQQLDQAVARTLSLPIDDAAAMRSVIAAAESLDPDNDVHRTVIDAIRNSLENIASEIELCLRYYKVTFRGRPLDGVIVTGSEATPWLVEFLSDRLGTPCRLADPFAALQTEALSPAARERAGRWTAAIGLSLKMLG